MVKNLPANSGDTGLIPGLGRSPGEENGNPIQYSCLGNPIKRSLVGYSPWGCKELDTTVHIGVFYPALKTRGCNFTSVAGLSGLV